ncbi:MAG: hypothetical protein C0596_00345 [Marinilabiliales bacterium]|nr:MAG: hypothetical protein C0596_00345 [Marinilabiliales bacterium]
MFDSIYTKALLFLIIISFFSCVGTKIHDDRFHTFTCKSEWSETEIEICESTSTIIEGSDSTKIIFKKTNLPGQGQAQPLLRTVWRKPKNRTYVVSVQFCNKRNDLCFDILPDSAKTGLVGHELVHVQDYKNRGFFNMLWMGIKYSLCKKYRTRIEYVTDSTTIANGMGYEVLNLLRFVENSGLAS